MKAFTLEASKAMRLATSSTEIKIFQHLRSNFKVLVVDIPGPLCSATVVVPTTTTNDKGLAHTLEHLIFCGSENYGYKGYLDLLATRAQSTGTNAYTTEDHTGYTITTAGFEGMLQLLPVYFDHILKPTLKSSQFVTEVFHIDGQGKHQGVVHCEMASRENTEADLLDLNMRRLLYQNQTTYAFECGGLTKDIRKLQNEDIIEYHKRFYHPDHLTLIVTGSVDCERLLAELENIDALSSTLSRPLAPIISPKLNKRRSLISRVVKFPSEDESLGSISYGWRGPRTDNVETMLALDVLFRFLQDTSSSPLSQKFVEIQDPLASDVEYEVKCFVDSCYVLIFSGVPFEDASSSSESEEDMSDSEKIASCFEGDYFFSLLKATILEAVENLTSEKILNTISRHKQKLVEALEEDPHEFISYQLIIDVVRSKLSPDGEHQTLGTRVDMFKILENLRTKPLDFWIDLCKNWLIDASIMEVKMIPSLELAESNAKKERDMHSRRVKKFGVDGLKRLEEIASKSVEENKIDIPSHTISSMPHIPVENFNRIPSKITTSSLISGNHPFAALQLIVTNTAFSHIRFGLNSSQIPENLKSVLVLFQELLFQSAIIVSKNNTKPYQEVVEEIAKTTVSCEAAFGFGNDIWHSSWLSEVFMVSTSFLPERSKEVIDLILMAFFKTCFTDKSRLMTTCKNLLSMITDSKRSGPDMLVALMTRLSSGSFEQCQNNDLYISLFHQETFLKSIVDGEISASIVFEQLSDLRRHFIEHKSTIGGFLQISSQNENFNQEIRSYFLRKWEHYSLECTGVESRDIKFDPKSPFPFPRNPYKNDEKSEKSYLIPIAGLSTSFLSQIVSCDILSIEKRDEYFPVIVLAEILSRTEGPIYNRIRGNGFAYGAYIELYMWSGQLVFEIQDSSEPMKALTEFYSIIEELNDLEKFKRICSQFDIETAKASIAYKNACTVSTAGSIIFSSLKSNLRGFSSLEQEQEFQKLVHEVSDVDLRKVYEKYYRQFLNVESRLTAMTTGPGQLSRELKDSFSNCEKAGINFEITNLKDFQL